MEQSVAREVPNASAARARGSYTTPFVFTAMAVAGDFEQATTTGRLALRVAKSQGLNRVARVLEAHLKLYAERRAFPPPGSEE